MKPHILIATHFVALPGEPGFNRFTYLANQMCEAGWDVTMVTSSFSHYLKSYRSQLINLRWNIVLVDEPGYHTNISLARIESHRQFSVNLEEWLSKQDGSTYSLVYAGVPTPASALATGRFAARVGIPFVVDVQDIWPDAFVVGLSPKKNVISQGLVHALGWPIVLQNRQLFRLADRVFSVSETYLEWARSFGANTGSVYRIGADLDMFAEAVPWPKPPGEIWLTYAGTISHSYDLKTLLRAMTLLPARSEGRVICNIVGDGPLRHQIERFGRAIGADVRFWGTLTYADTVRVLKASDVGLNTIVGSSQTSLPNKVFDYLAAGLPVINSVTGELARILENYTAGYQYAPGDARNLALVIDKAISDQVGSKTRSKGALDAAAAIGDRKRMYSSLIEELGRLASAGTKRPDCSDRHEALYRRRGL